MNPSSTSPRAAAAAPSPADEPLLDLRGIDCGYGRVEVLRQVSLQVHERRIVTVLGGNGAGKSTLLKAISGLLPLTAGTVRFAGEPIGGLPPARIVDRGLLHVAEGRRLFRTQSVLSNLDLGLYGAGLSRAEEKRRLDQVLSTFPMLAERPQVAAGALSGGQQQMLAIAQALLRTPRLLMLDEPSLGLAPIVVDQVIDVILKLRDQGCAIVLVEQLVERALEVADFVYVLQSGRIIGSGTPAELSGSEMIRHAYLGV
ncbi:MAG TPA: ABC transporter ATP-binding protein [Burkholderiaceae bacterium]|nr:ABC transporter ATP-binding protein [Burkholderiaceae bacterium]